MPIALTQSMLRFDRHAHDLRGLALASSFEDEVGTCLDSMIVAGFDEDAAQMSIPRLGDRPALMTIARGVLAGHETDPGHESPRRAEALDVADLSREGHGRQGLDAAEALQRFDHRLVGWALRIAFDLGVERADLGLEVLQELEFRLEDGGDGALGLPAHLGQPSAVLLRPVALAVAEDASLTQELAMDALLALLGLEEKGETGAHERSNRLLLLIRHLDGSEMTAAVEASERQRVATVGLAPIPGLVGMREGAITSQENPSRSSTRWTTKPTAEAS